MVSKTAAEPVPVQGKTGRFIDNVVGQLIVSVKDIPKEKINELDAIRRALIDIGHQHPVLTTSSALNFLTSQALSVTQRISLLQLVAAVVENTSTLERSLANDVARVAVSEVTATKDIVPEWQAAASAVIAAVCKYYPSSAHASIISCWAPGTLPHYFLLRCVAEFAQFNPTYLVPNLTEISTRVVNSVGLIKNPNLKWATADAVTNFCEAIQHVAADQHDTSSVRGYSSELAPVFDTLVGWVASKETQVKLHVIETIGALTVVIPCEFLRPRIPKIMMTLMPLLKKEKDF
ncbi:hypothetical protein GEMRC1_003532 [Eukaryota sp. GEM-RC1]